MAGGASASTGGANAACTLPPSEPRPSEPAAGATQPTVLPTVAAPQEAERRPLARQPRAQGRIRDLLAAKARRTPAQRKVDSRLLERATAETLRASGQFLPQDGQAPGNRPGEERRDAADRALVDIRADVTPAVLGRIRELGGTVVNGVPRYRAIWAPLPLPSVERLAAVDAVQTIRTADEAVTRKDDTSEGDGAHRASLAAGLTAVVTDLRPPASSQPRRKWF